MAPTATACLALTGALLIGAAPPRAVFTSAGWVTFDRGNACEATARSDRTVANREDQPHAAFVFDRSGPRRGQFAAQLGHRLPPGATVLLTVGDQPFLLTSADRFAWSRGRAQEYAIIAAARFAPALRVEARSPGGGRFVDRYPLDGAAGAIDAAAACSAQRR